MLTTLFLSTFAHAEFEPRTPEIRALLASERWTTTFASLEARERAQGRELSLSGASQHATRRAAWVTVVLKTTACDASLDQKPKSLTMIAKLTPIENGFEIEALYEQPEVGLPTL